MGEMIPGPSGQPRWSLGRHTNTVNRRNQLKEILAIAGSRVATAWAHQVFGVTDSNNPRNKNRHPLFWLFHELSALADGDSELYWFGRKVLVGWNLNAYITHFDIETVDGSLRLCRKSYNGGMQVFWDREPTDLERAELAFFIRRHDRPEFAIYS